MADRDVKYGRLRVGLLVAAALWLLAGSLLPLVSAAEAPTQDAPPEQYGTAVYVVPVKQAIESGLASFMERAFKEAEEASAAHIILEIDTFGGRVDSADAIGALIRGSEIPVVAFVENNAISAGAYIALNADQIVMAGSSTIGNAGVVDGSGELIENPKVVSMWVEKMRAAALLNDRNPALAVAMVDPNAVVEMPEINRTVQAGELLTLNASDALAVGYAEHIAGSVEETIAWLGLESRTVIEVELTGAELLARWITSPAVAFILLILGLAGVGIELFVPGFGVPGIVGVSAFLLFFFGNYIAGFAGLESIVLFVIGIGLLIIELFVPSFGILGTLGIVSLIGGIISAAYDTGEMAMTLLYAGLVAIGVIVVFAYIFRRRGVWNRFILDDRMTTEQGYVPTTSKTDLLGKDGVTVTQLRPSGTVEIGDVMVDVVTEGPFIERDRPVRVIRVEGARVVVREKK